MDLLLWLSTRIVPKPPINRRLDIVTYYLDSQVIALRSAVYFGSVESGIE